MCLKTIINFSQFQPMSYNKYNYMNSFPNKTGNFNKQYLYRESALYDYDQNGGNIQIQQYDPIQTKCRKLAYINENIAYNISILQTQLQALKKGQIQKSEQNKKAKQKLKQKLEKEQEMKRHLKIEKNKIKKLLNGLKHLNKQVDQASLRQQKTRENRLKAQQNKNSKYEQYHKTEQQYRQFIFNIKQLDGLFEELKEAEKQNQTLKAQIKQIQDCLNEQNSTREDTVAIKKQRNNKIKDLNSKVLELEKQQNYLNSQINKIQKMQMIWEIQRQKIQEKSAQTIVLYKKIQEAKNNLISKKSQLTQIDSAFKQLCIQQNRIKKQMILEKQCRQQQKRYKQSMKKRPPPPEFQASPKTEIRIHSPGESVVPMEDSTINKLQSIVKRFENIKNKNTK